MKKIRYSAVIIAALLMMLLFSSCSSWTFIRYIYEYHREYYEAEEFLPSGFASYESVKYDHDKKILLFFFTDTMTVKVKYDDFYIPYKHFLEDEYDFLTEPVESDMLEGHYLIPVTEFEYKGFHMRVADGGDYPHKFGIVGYNDDTKEIAYLWFYDTDFDYIASPEDDKEQAMKDFIKEYFDMI